MPRKVVISHFWNEEFMLPYWLKHHRNLFDHGVMINYHSTDSSCDIIRELCPTWELRTTRLGTFFSDPLATDIEVMDIERGLGDCYKIALNTTEFVMHWDLDWFLDFQARPFKNYNFRTQGFYMFDPPELKEKDVDPSEYLVLQRTCGGKEIFHQSRARLLHRHDCGRYLAGRHQTAWPDQFVHPSFYLLWYNFSPFKQMMHRGTKMRRRHAEELVNRGLSPASSLGNTGGLHTEEGWRNEERACSQGQTYLCKGILPPVDLTHYWWFSTIQAKIRETWPRP